MSYSTWTTFFLLHTIALQLRVMADNKWCSTSPSASLREMFFSKFAIDPRSSVARRQLSVTLYVALASRRTSLPSGQPDKPRWKTHRRRTSVLWYLPGKRTRNENGERYCPPTNVANSQVRQLDSTCNLIFTVVGTAQTWTLLSYSLRCDNAFIPNHRFHQKRLTVLRVLKSVRSFNVSRTNLYPKVFVLSLSLYLSPFLLVVKLRQECEKYETIQMFDLWTDIKTTVSLSNTFFERCKMIIADSRLATFLYRSTNCSWIRRIVSVRHILAT